MSSQTCATVSLAIKKTWLLGDRATHLCGGYGGGDGGGVGAVLEGKVCDEDDELGEGPADLGARALQQVLGEAVGVGEQDVVCKPVADILTVS